MVPDVMQAVTGHLFQTAQATLPGYERYRIKRQVYPGIVACDNGLVDGILNYAVDDRSLQRLDEFESEVYQRRRVIVQLSGAGNVEAWAYVIAPQYEHLLSKDAWDLETFKRQHLRRYLAPL